VKRFFESAKIYRLNLAQDRHTVSEACKDVVRANGLASAYVRPLGFQGATRLGLNPGEDPARLAIIAVEWGTLHGESSLDDGIDVCVSSWARLTPNTLPVMAKAGGHYLNSQLIHSEAERHGYQEGVGLAPSLTVRDGVLITPALTGSLLGGITRDSVLKLAADLGIPSETATIPREMLYTADEVFMTGTAAEITPIRSVDRISVGDGKPGEVTCALQTAFFGLFSAETKDSRGWLEPV
jgi:branched-chain amino acid aminotransferase